MGHCSNHHAHTLLQVEVLQIQPRVHVSLEGGHKLGHNIPTQSLYQDAIEVCAGIGMMGEGIQACGIKIRVANDLRQELCHFQERQGQVNVIAGDIRNPDVIAQIFEAFPQPALLSSGFSCQPWSRLGDGGKSQDPRSSTLVGVLEMAYWLRSHSVLLECVEGAGKDPEVQHLLQEFCQITKFCHQQVDLQLETMLPAKRDRWWCLLTNPSVPSFALRKLPALTIPPVLGDLLPFCPEWDQFDMEQLCLDLYETNKFAEFDGLLSNIVTLNKPVRTALHGWSNQLSGCPCGCREYPFAESRLKAKGIFGALIPTEGHIRSYMGTLPNTRHMHPWEMSLLHGARPNREWKPRLRLSIAGLGQMAAPVQSCWVVGQFVSHLQRLEGMEVGPESFLWNHMTTVFQVVQSDQPMLFHHPNFQMYITRVHQALSQSAQTHQVPAHPIGEESRDDQTSHRKGREDPQLSNLKQPANRTQEPRKDEKNIEESKTPAEETQGLHLPMFVQAKPAEAFAFTGPSPPNKNDMPHHTFGGEGGMHFSQSHIATEGTRNETHPLESHQDQSPKALAPEQVEKNPHHLSRDGTIGDYNQPHIVQSFTQHPIVQAEMYKADHLIESNGACLDHSSSKPPDAPDKSQSASDKKEVGPVAMPHLSRDGVPAIHMPAGSLLGVGPSTVQTAVLSRDEPRGQSALAVVGIDNPIGDTTKEDQTSHRKGREDPYEEMKQPADRTQEPRRDRKEAEAHKRKPLAEETQGLHLPMTFQAMPVGTPVTTGPSPDPSLTMPHRSIGGSEQRFQLEHRACDNGLPDPKRQRAQASRKDDHCEPMVNDHNGGIQAFATVPNPSKSTSNMLGDAGILSCDPRDTDLKPKDEGLCNHTPDEDGFTQEMVEVAARYEQMQIDQSSPKSNTQQMPSSTVCIQIVHPEAREQFFTKVEAEATVGSITVAEAKLSSLAQPIRVNTSMGTPIKIAETMTPMQQVFLREMSERGKTHSCPPGILPVSMLTDQPKTRLEVLYQQEAWVAVDEMDFYLELVTSTGLANKGPIMTVPLHYEDEEIEPMLQRWTCSLAPHDAAPGLIATAIWVEEHWIPVVIHLDQGKVTVCTTQGGKNWMDLATRALGNHLTVIAIPITEAFPNDCGFQAIGWLMSATTDPEFFASTSAPPAVTVDDAIMWRGLFESHLINTKHATQIVIPANMKFGGVNTSDIPEQVKELLTSHGVPPEVAQARANVVVEKLGRQQVARALRLADPWKEIKNLANHMTPRLQLVLPSEMQLAIQARTANHKTIGAKQKKVKQERGPRKALQITADDVSVPEGVFCDDKPSPMHQIPFGTIGPEARGIVILQADKASPYLRITQPISKHGLALLIVDHQSTIAQGVGEVIRFPARCERTGEAILLTGRIVQLGMIPVTRRSPEAKTKVDEVLNQVFRIVVYKDELEEMQWDNFIARPVKCIVAALPFLQPSSDGHNPIIDLWDRQYLTEKLERTRPADADLFMTCVRLEQQNPSDGHPMVDKAGFYLEPRASDGRSPDPQFRVIWLAKADRQTAILASQSTIQWNTVVRSGNRFGLRVKLGDAAQVHAQHKPNTPYLDGDKVLTFQAGPFPHGTNRAALIKLFAKWQWAARPCQPRSRAPNGMGIIWEVQAVTRPQFEVYQLDHADVLITEIVKKPRSPLLQLMSKDQPRHWQP